MIGNVIRARGDEGRLLMAQRKREITRGQRIQKVEGNRQAARGFRLWVLDESFREAGLVLEYRDRSGVEWLYVTPWNSSHEGPLSADQDFVWFTWHVTCQKFRNVSTSGGAHMFAVVVHPGGRLEEFPVTTRAASSPNIQVVGGKLWSLRPEGWDNELTNPLLTTAHPTAHPVVPVWGDKVGPVTSGIKSVVYSHEMGVPVYIGFDGEMCSGKPADWYIRSLDNTEYFRGSSKEFDTTLVFSRSPAAERPEHSLCGVGPNIMLSPSGRVVYMIRDRRDASNGRIYAGRELIAEGDILGVHRKDDGCLHAIERLPGDGRRTHAIL